MPTQEESLSTVEQAQVRVGEAISDLNHHVTMLIGIVQRQEWDLREIKGSLRAIDGRLSSLEGRFETQERRLESLEQNVDTRFETLEQSMNTHFEALDKKFDQILLLLSTNTPKSD
jgi:predicted  nucleic acid-binding Zn-ribbon protein